MGGIERMTVGDYMPGTILSSLLVQTHVNCKQQKTLSSRFWLSPIMQIRKWGLSKAESGFLAGGLDKMF